VNKKKSFCWHTIQKSLATMMFLWRAAATGMSRRITIPSSRHLSTRVVLASSMQAQDWRKLQLAALASLTATAAYQKNDKADCCGIVGVVDKSDSFDAR
jgi:hypothetical protein